MDNKIGIAKTKKSQLNEEEENGERHWRSSPRPEHLGLGFYSRCHMELLENFRQENIMIFFYFFFKEITLAFIILLV